MILPTYFGSLSGLLAQAANGAGAPPDQGQSILTLVAPMLVIAVLFYFMMMRPERQKQAAHRALLEGLKKNDRVVTIGGIYGVVMNVQRDADEVTIKIDEANNTKIRVTFSAIARVMTDEPAAEKPA